MDTRKDNRRIFLQIKKDNPQEVVYSVNYQIGADEEYFDMFKVSINLYTN